MMGIMRSSSTTERVSRNSHTSRMASSPSAAMSNLVLVLQDNHEHLAIDGLVVNNEDAPLPIDSIEVCASFEHNGSFGGSERPTR